MSAERRREAGAPIVHLHARNPEDGRPDQVPEAFAPFLKAIRRCSDVVINLTTGGAPFMTVEERVKPAGGNVRVGLEIASPAEARKTLQLKGGDRTNF